MGENFFSVFFFTLLNVIRKPVICFLSFGFACLSFLLSFRAIALAYTLLKAGTLYNEHHLQVHNRWGHLYQVGIKHCFSLELLTNAQNISPSNWLPNKKRSRCLAWSLDITCIPVNLFLLHLRNSEEKLPPSHTFSFQNKAKQ